MRDVLAGDSHGVVLATERGVLDGELLEFTSVHVWNFRDGKCVQFMSYEDDIYHQFWSASSLAGR